METDSGASGVARPAGRPAGRPSLPAALLGVSPAVAAATTGLGGIALGAALFGILLIGGTVLTLLGLEARRRLRLVVHIGLVAALATAAEALLGRWLPAARSSLGASLYLAAAGCVVVGRALPSRPPRAAARAALEAGLTGLGLAASLVAIACLREALGAGTITLLPVKGFSGVLKIGVLARNPSDVARGAAGGLLVLGLLMGLARWIAIKRGRA